MPRTTKREKRPTERLAPVPDEILDHFAPDRPMTAEEIDAAGRRLKKALMERMLGGELSHHLGYPPGGVKPDATTNHRNGTVRSACSRTTAPMAVEIPRDRDGTFEPQLIPKHARRLAGFDDKVLALYARGLPVREIQKFLAEIYAHRRLARSDQRGHRRGRGRGDRRGRRGRSSRSIRSCSSTRSA